MGPSAHAAGGLISRSTSVFLEFWMNEHRHCHSDQRLPAYGDEAGQTMVEYGFVLIAVALAVTVGYQLFGGRVSDLVNTVTW